MGYLKVSVGIPEVGRMRASPLFTLLLAPFVSAGVSVVRLEFLNFDETDWDWLTRYDNETATPGIALDELTVPETPFDVDEALANLTTVCLSRAQIEAFTGNIVRSFYAVQMILSVMPAVVHEIGLQELRTVLDMPSRKGPTVPPVDCKAGFWGKDENPSDEELKAAPTLEAYYELREPPIVSPFMRMMVNEANVVAGLSFVDAHMPVIRDSIRQTLEQKRLSYGMIDRKVIDSMIGDYDAITSKIERATTKMVEYRSECEEFKC